MKLGEGHVCGSLGRNVKGKGELGMGMTRVYLYMYEILMSNDNNIFKAVNSHRILVPHIPLT